MLLTTITLNKSGRGLVHDAQAVHRTLKYLDPNVLWGCPDGLHLIVQHAHPIDWTTGLGRAMRMAHTTYAHQPDVGDTVGIAMIGNPTLCQPRPGQKRGKRVPAPPDKWMGWLHKRLDPCLTIHHVEATKLTPAREHHSGLGPLKARNTTLQATHYGQIMWHVEATDEQRLIELLATCTHIGARHRNGFGHVTQWETRPGPVDGWKQRPMPTNDGGRMMRVRAPYWHPTERTHCQ